MVRLKEKSVLMLLLPSVKFQFLMVRLKAQLSRSFNAHQQISIPYGAIKSWFIQLSEFADSISIPYGAIKSPPFYLSPYLLLFISIPYGAIKRKNI